MFDRPHFYLTFGGDQLNGAETWQTGCRFAPTPEITEGELLAALTAVSVNDIFTDLAAVITATAPGQRFATHQKLRWTKLAVIGQDGLYAGAPKIFEGTASGTLSSSNGHPPQLAVVVSLWTGLHFGKAQRGRQYWPMPADFITAIDASSGQIPVATANAFRDKVKTALVAAQGEVGTVGATVSLAVMSKIGDSPAGTGPTNPVTSIGVGQVIDTTRSRREALNDVKTYAVYP